MTKKIIITGATGWLGQEYLYSQYKKYGKNFIDDYILVGNMARSINLFGEIPVQVYSLDNLNPLDEIEGIIHLAYVLRHRVKEFGVQEFLKRNEQITKKIVEIVLIHKPKWIVNVSSGAIFERETGEFETNPEKNPYGYGKRQEELALLEVASKFEIPLVIGRLWGASGYKMPPNPAYAFSDFVGSAILKGQITIQSDFKVFRRYCDAGEFLEVLVSEACLGNSLILNSGGPLHEIEEIAEMIKALVGNVTIHRPLIENRPVDDYYPRESNFESIAFKNGIELASMRIQVQRTVDGHRDVLNK